MAWRREKKHIGVASLDAVHTDMDGNEFALKDLLPGPDDAYDLGGPDVRPERLRLLNPDERRLFDLMVQFPGRRQVDYGRMMGISQAVTSRRMKAIREKLRG